MYSIEEGRLSNIICICPPIRSAKAAEVPRYGTSINADAGHHLEQLTG
jgi:hypothetical protein